jgi:hypothetical protein
MAARAKFQVVKKSEIADGFTIELYPVVNGSDENKKFYKYTPWGKIEIGTISKEASDGFIVGKQYYVDFTAE